MSPLILALCLGAWAAPAATVNDPTETTVASPAEQVESSIADEEAFERLFGGDEPAAPVERSAPPFKSSIPVGAWAAALIGLGGLFFLRQRVTKGSSVQRPMQVLGRVSLGREGSLTVVEVTAIDGSRSRLLVGAGGGAPQLVTDLGSVAVAATVEEVAEPAESDESGKSGALRSARSKAGAWARALRAAGAEVPADGVAMKARIADRGDLVAEVLAERRAARRPLTTARNPLKRRGLVA